MLCSESSESAFIYLELTTNCNFGESKIVKFELKMFHL